ncbi:GmrSD restriction endonuclease domain-containing protein [Candidatus Spongiisocius sp.]|uniref:GmrSD restriction endonuclease domain-containing protein n=1 Tax=Candidatus Spongiisocius sp. TaxID=3101273 RepID=UPI003B593DAE
MRNSQKPDHVSLTNMLTRLREGRYVIPDFQRAFEWEPSDINELMRSIFRDYYIGSLLLWKGKEENFEALSCEPIYGVSSDKGRTDIVLDGQQRLTAMYYAFVAPDEAAPKRRNRFLYFIKVDCFIDEVYEEAFIYDWTRRGLNILKDRQKQFETHLFPLSVIGTGGWDLPNWVQDYEKHWLMAAETLEEHESDVAMHHADRAKKFGEQLKAITEQYQISYIELDRDLEIDKVCDIFTQINSRGRRLDVFDLLNALLRPKGIRLRQDLWRDAAPRLDFVKARRINVYVLQVMSILRQAYCSPKYLYHLIPGSPRQVRGEDGTLRPDVLVSDTSEFTSLWYEAVDALVRAIDLLRHPREFGVISNQYLPYASILPAFATLQAEAQRLPPDQRLDAQGKIQFWYWASVFMNRYSGAVESTSARDYTDMKTWFGDDRAEPGLVAEFEGSVQNLDLRRETRRGTSVYNGMFNLLVLNGARDWVSGNVPQHGDMDDHHIVPKSLGSDFGRKTSIDTIVNRTPLTRVTNREVIKDRLPNVYLPELIAANGEEKVVKILRSHFISHRAFSILMRYPFTPEDFEDFVEEREKTFRGSIGRLADHRTCGTPPGCPTR